MKLAEIADRIDRHLKRFEAATQGANAGDKHGLRPYYRAGARPTGARVSVVYVSYQGRTTLTKAQALTYMHWLDAGGVGKHWDALGKGARRGVA